MASGIKRACNRPKLPAHLKTGRKNKRFRVVNEEAQGAYHAKIAARRAKKLAMGMQKGKRRKK